MSRRTTLTAQRDVDVITSVWNGPGYCGLGLRLAERRAKAFTAGTIKAALGGGYGDDAARFYAAEAAKVIQAFFHAAANFEVISARMLASTLAPLGKHRRNSLAGVWMR